MVRKRFLEFSLLPIQNSNFDQQLRVNRTWEGVEGQRKMKLCFNLKSMPYVITLFIVMKDLKWTAESIQISVCLQYKRKCFYFSLLDLIKNSWVAIPKLSQVFFFIVSPLWLHWLRIITRVKQMKKEKITKIIAFLLLFKILNTYNMKE